MTFNLFLLALGVVLLWFPRHWMRRGLALLKRRRRSKGSERILEPWKDREPGDPQVNFRVEFTKFRNYCDLVRAAAGGLVICGGAGVVPGIILAANAPRSASYQALALKSAIVIVGVLIQAVRYEKYRLSFFPPIFFLAGLSVSLCGYPAAGLAFVMIWAVNPVLSNAQAFLTAYAVLLVGFGSMFLHPGHLMVMLAGGLAFLPVLLSLLARRPLVIFNSRGSRSPKPA
jgi:hypothetical protein